MDIPSAVLGQGSSVDQAHPLDTSHVRDVDAPAASPTPVSHSLLAQEVAGAQPELAAAVVRGGGGNVRFFAEEMLNSRLVLGAVLVDRVYAHSSPPCFERLPNEILLHVLGFLDVSDLLVTSRINHILRALSLLPVLHQRRRRHYRDMLSPLLFSPLRPSLADLASRSIFKTKHHILSRSLSLSFTSIRLNTWLRRRPSPEALVHRAVLPPECVPGGGVHVAAGLVAARRAVEKARLKDGLRRWMAGQWSGRVAERQERVRRSDESRGVGRVWRLTRYWERVSRGERMANR